MNQNFLKNQQLLAEAQRLHAAGEPAAALGIYQRLHKAEPQNAMLLYLMGAAEMSLGRTPEARTHLSAATARSPGNVGAWHDLAMVHKRDGRFGEAHAAIDRALSLKPQDPSLCAAKSGIHFMEGRFEAAAEAIAPVISRQPPHLSVAMALGRIAPRTGKQAEAISLLRACLEETKVTPALRADLLFQLGMLLDSQKEFDAAFAAVKEAHAQRTRRFDPDAFEKVVDAACQSWTAAALAGVPRGKMSSERAVFIVGMPRSGTSLVEQILSSHPQVFGAGELDDLGRAVFEITGPAAGVQPPLADPQKLTRKSVDSIERAYLETLRKLSPSATRITDKMPSNFLHIGVIAAALPKARIIHCVRDARDTCLSCYFQNFGGRHAYVEDLAGLGRYYRQYERLMDHWTSLSPLPMLEVRYESLVDDLESHARSMVEFLGLKWDPACLAFHESKRITRTSSNDQVRRPLYKGSVQRWRSYERHLGPLLEALGPR